MKFDFTNKRVLVTGGTRGIGRATVEAFLDAGARVAVNGRTSDSVAKAISGLDAGDRVVPVPGDIGAVDGCRQVVEDAIGRLGGLDILVNNAGGGEDRPIEEMTAEEWDRTMNLNLRGPFLCTKHAVKALRSARGNVVNIASIFGLRGTGRGTSAYCASKGGVVNLTRDLAAELGPDIRVNCLCPGYIDTDMLRDYGSMLGKGDVAMGYEMLRDSASLGRVARTAEMASVILYLASDHASFVTGSIHVADGGAISKV
jgi:NAD(P)-dependent dehydrogenase (short-subunit alcohol dehydrogenase family)